MEINKQYFKEKTTEEIKTIAIVNNILLKQYFKDKQIDFNLGSYRLPSHIFSKKYRGALASVLSSYSPYDYNKLYELLENRIYYEPDIIKSLRLEL